MHVYEEVFSTQSQLFWVTRHQRRVTLLIAATLALFAWTASGGSVSAREGDTPMIGFHVARGDAEHMAAAQIGGGEFVVVVFSWQDIEPTPGYFYWEQPDAVLRAAHHYGLDVVARLDRPPAWARDDNDATPWSLAHYARFVQQVSQRYGDRLAGAIIWNEPNLSLEWANQRPDPQGYAAMLAAAYTAVKSVAPDLPVLAAGLAFTEGEGDGDAVTALNDLDFMQDLCALGAGAYFDVLAAHPYGFGQTSDEPADPRRLNFRRLELHYSLLSQCSDALYLPWHVGHSIKPVWVTEMGWRTAAPDPIDAWQVVTAQTQAEYILRTFEIAAQEYPWLERMALWELNAGEDLYGYGLWRGESRRSLAYDLLAETYGAELSPPSSAQDLFEAAQSIEILAANVIIRLGDVDTLHPHWVHLHHDGEGARLTWRGEFFMPNATVLERAEENVFPDFELVLETMQVNQPLSEIHVNGRFLAYIPPRTRADPTSTWITQRLYVPGEFLQGGVNEVRIESGLRNPARQYAQWRWDNFQFRNLRLETPYALPEPAATVVTQLPGPQGHMEVNRIRHFVVPASQIRADGHTDGNFDIWVVANRAGQIWQAQNEANGGRLRFQNQAANLSDRIFNDVLATAGWALAATHEGLWIRVLAGDRQSGWRRVAGAPEDFAYVVTRSQERYYAGFAQSGLWSAPSVIGPWRAEPILANAVLDVIATPAGPVAATASGIWARDGNEWTALPLLPETPNDGEFADALPARLYSLADGSLAVFSQDRLWRWTEYLPWHVGHSIGEWHPFGPQPIQDRVIALAARCCDARSAGELSGAFDPILLSNGHGLWRLDRGGAWQRVDGGFFDGLTLTAGLFMEDIQLVGGMYGLFEAAEGLQVTGQAWPGIWQSVWAEASSAQVTALVAEDISGEYPVGDSSTAAARWYAGTPLGVFRSDDRGASWLPISPPWVVWNLTMLDDGTLAAATDSGVKRTVTPAAPMPEWQVSSGLETVTFFGVYANPVGDNVVWGGTWGNNVAVSADGGRTFERLDRGLETLSVLDITFHDTPGQATAGAIEGLLRTDNNGETWFRLGQALERQTVYGVLQARDGRMWAASGDGLWQSDDYGASWSRAPNVPIAGAISLGALEEWPTYHRERDHGEREVSGQQLLWAGMEDYGLWLMFEDEPDPISGVNEEAGHEADSMFEGAGWRFAGLAGHSVYAVLDGGDGRLVVATNRGIFLLEIE